MFGGPLAPPSPFDHPQLGRLIHWFNPNQTTWCRSFSDRIIRGVLCTKLRRVCRSCGFRSHRTSHRIRAWFWRRQTTLLCRLHQECMTHDIWKVESSRGSVHCPSSFIISRGSINCSIKTPKPQSFSVIRLANLCHPFIPRPLPNPSVTELWIFRPSLSFHTPFRWPFGRNFRSSTRLKLGSIVLFPLSQCLNYRVFSSLPLLLIRIIHLKLFQTIPIMYLFNTMPRNTKIQ